MRLDLFNLNFTRRGLDSYQPHGPFHRQFCLSAPHRGQAFSLAPSPLCQSVNGPVKGQGIRTN